MTLDFNLMTADQIRDYTGPRYWARIRACRYGDNAEYGHDLNSTTPAALDAKIIDLAREWRITSITRGRVERHGT